MKNSHRFFLVCQQFWFAGARCGTCTLTFVWTVFWTVTWAEPPRVAFRKRWCQKDSTSWERELRNHLISNFLERCRILTDWFLKQSVHLSDDCLVHWEVRRIPGSAHVITWKWCFFWLSPSVRMVFCPFGNGAMGSRGLFIARISARILMETGHGCWLATLIARLSWPST